MGAEGGIILVEIKYVRDNWTRIRDSFIGNYQEVVDNSPDYLLESDKKQLAKIKKLPLDISSLSNSEFGKHINGICYCGWPYVYKDTLIVGYGDNIPDDHSEINEIFEESVDVETWT